MRTLQRGRALVSAEISTAMRSLAASAALQRGRALVSAEIPWRRRHARKPQPASTGPRFGKRGDIDAAFPEHAQPELQRGRALVSAEI